MLSFEVSIFFQSQQSQIFHSMQCGFVLETEYQRTNQSVRATSSFILVHKTQKHVLRLSGMCNMGDRVAWSDWFLSNMGSRNP